MMRDRTRAANPAHETMAEAGGAGDIAAYIEVMSAELSALATGRKLEFLAYLLDLARAEAAARTEVPFPGETYGDRQIASGND